MNAQQYLNEYFSKVWSKNSLAIDDFKYSGLALVEKIKNSDHVLDIGCGRNLFKGRIKNLIGIDPAFDEADYKITLEQFALEYQGPKFNVAFCLGSINFGSKENIENQIGILTGLLEKESRIYWRCNPGLRDHRNTECQTIDFYPWSIDEHYRLAAKFGFNVECCVWDTHDRLYAEWQRR